MFCMSDDCHIRVDISVRNSQNLTCGGEMVPQVVIKQDSAMSSCGVSFTMDNWMEEMELPVYAVMDSLKDGTQMAMIDIESEAMAGGMSYSEVIMNEKDVEVCSITLFAIIPGKLRNDIEYLAKLNF